MDEEGTEAAAATGSTSIMISAIKQFNSDHPFLFKIVENKFGNVLFEGVVADPSIGVDAKRND